MEQTKNKKQNCPDCNSQNIKKAGKKITRHSKKQQYQCNECGRVFT